MENGKKKILHIVEAMGGGIFTYLVELANELVEHYDVYIAYAIRSETPDNHTEWEDLPISLLEAMYMKILCVVSDVIGNHDVIQNEKNGFVYGLNALSIGFMCCNNIKAVA